MFDIPAAVEAASSMIDGIVSRIWPDKTQIDNNKLERFKTELATELAVAQAQNDINLQEAKHASIFVSGWRPFVGWGCGVGLLYISIIEPIAKFIALVGFGYAGEFPVVDTDITLQVLLGMLGLAGMRSFEKSKHVSRNK
jgi:hypothetical protein